MLRKSQQTRDNLTEIETFHVEPDSPGKRLYLIRLACGDGLRRPESMRDFVLRVKKATGEAYDPSTVSMLERDAQGWRLKDMNAFASVDPLKRGGAWLGFGVTERSAIDINPNRDHRLTREEEDRALASEAAEQTKRSATKQSGRKARGKP